MADHRYRLSLLLLLAALLPASSVTNAGTLSELSQQRWVSVAKVYASDTFETMAGEKVRLLGINTPEIAHDDSPDEPWGELASQALLAMVGGKQLRLEFDEEKYDQFGRTLAQAWLQDGTWVNGTMVREGYAHVYTFAPNLRWGAALLAEEQQARQARLGIWSHPRFAVLAAKEVSRRHIGEFRLVEGSVAGIATDGWRFRLGDLNVSVPRSYRRWFKRRLSIRSGQQVIVRGKIRISSAGRLFLALHTPLDLEVGRP